MSNLYEGKESIKSRKQALLHKYYLGGKECLSTRELEDLIEYLIQDHLEVNK